MVLGERLDDLARELQAMRFDEHDDGMTRVEFTSHEDGPFFRAFRRAEAEVVLSGGRRAWNTETRQYDAFLMVFDRVREAVTSSTT